MIEEIVIRLIRVVGYATVLETDGDVFLRSHRLVEKFPQAFPIQALD